MVFITDSSGKHLCHLLAVIRRRGNLLSPYFYSQCLILGEGEYEESAYKKEDLFLRMLMAITKKLKNRCLYIEFSNLTIKMFGYKAFRKCHYFPVHWMHIHNSLHSRTPEERLSQKMLDKITVAQNSGVTSHLVTSKEDCEQVTRLIRRYYKFRIRRYCPNDKFFQLLNDSDNARIFITKYEGKIIGCSLFIISENNAYLWFAAHKNIGRPHLHSETMSIWAAIKYAYTIKLQHIFFLDVGLPFHKNRFRDFILKFGGKPVGTNRWFRFNIRWINSIASWIYR